MESFNEIYILDLHGNSLKKEKCPDGAKDENVFDIRQGVAIALFIKTKSKKKECRVSHSEIWGLREKKNDWLSENNIKTTTWEKLSPKSEFYLFVPRDEGLFKAYEKYLKITDVFPLNSVGIVTSRDSFVIDFDKEELKRRIRMFRDGKMPDEVVRQAFHLKDKATWKLCVVRERIKEDEKWEDSITQILYRPFDVRWIFYHDEVIERSRKEVMRHMMKEDWGLILPKRVETQMQWGHTFCTTKIVEHVAVSLKTIDYLFPLYLYQEKNNPGKRSPGGLMMFFEPKKDYEAKKPNISPTLIEQLTKNFKRAPSPEQIFFYIYAVLYSNTYRTQYAEFLKTDFPRIPFTRDYRLFIRMGEYGKGLADLHLLKSPELDSPIAKLQDKGNYKIEKVKYEKECVYINDEQCFEGVKTEVYQYQVGGYQVCDKWLKDRKGRTLSLDEIKNYCIIVTALQKTFEIQKAIDDIFPDVEKETTEAAE
jgi:predicted helicase